MVYASLDAIDAEVVLHSGPNIYFPSTSRHPFLAIKTADIILRSQVI